MIFFDLDDTLFEERAFCRSAYSEIADFLTSVHGIDFSKAKSVMTDLLNRRENPFNWLEKELTRQNLNHDGYVKELVEMYRNHCPDFLPAFQNMHQTFAVLKNRGYRLGLITDGRSATQRNKIRALNLEQYFNPEDILISEETGRDKTSAECFRKAMSISGSERYYAYIGDNTSKDFLQPNLLDWTTFCLRHLRPGVHSQDFTHSYPEAPRYIISSLRELLLFFP